MTKKTQKDVNTYDEVPYESNPYANSHPAHLSTIGQIFGMDIVLPEKARILELGCSSGGNIIPLALQYPNAEIIGIDLSKVQIDMANKVVEDLKLKNIQFHACSIMDIEEQFGKFDYIIVHGIISWVPEEVQKKIFDVCGKILTKNGIAYISYNTLPGWNMVKTIRDMMLYHTAGFNTIQEKLSQARLLLQFVIDSLEGSETPYAEVLRNEAKLLAQQPDSYLRHDHLEDNNVPFYFKDFIGQAQAVGLQYLGDSSLASMYIGNMPAKAVEKLQEVNDIVRSEQYMDFINNRRFRMTLLCRNDVQLNRALSENAVKKLWVSMVLDAVKPETKAELTDATLPTQFFINNNKEATITTTAPRIKAMFYTLAENKGRYMSFTEILDSVVAKLGEKDRAAAELEIAAQLLRFILAGHISAKAQNVSYAKQATNRPKVLDIAIYQASFAPNMWVTNAKHERVAVNIFDKFALRYCDGKHDLDGIVEKLFTHVDNGELAITKQDKQITDRKSALPELKKALEQGLDNWAKSALLEG